MTYLLLFIEFFKTGLFAIGGGLATLPFLFDIADRYPWFDRPMLMNMIAVAESTPGPIGVNVATYAGFTSAGLLGGLIATFALVLPSYIVIVIIAQFLAKFSSNPVVKSVFYGIRPAATGMIAAAGFAVLRTTLLYTDRFAGLDSLLSVLNIPAIILFTVLYYLYIRFNKHPIFYIAGAAAIGIIFKL
ncbi:MAG: chromate transporter [Candidatus Fimivivens sp.]|nr:chromate transporter [Candidatus Fimivivens sp.]